MRRFPFAPWTLCAAATLVVAAMARPASAQAWLPAKGEGTVSVLFTNISSRHHVLPDRRYDFGRIYANTLLADVTYGITNRVAVTFGVPVVVSRYRGTAP